MKANAGLARLIVGIVRRQKGDINGRSVSWICERGQIDCPRGSDAVWFAWAPASRVDHLATRSRRTSCRRCALPPYKGRNRGGCGSGPSIDGEPVADTAPCLQRCGCQWYARPHQYEQLRRRSPDPGCRFYLQVEVRHSFRFVISASEVDQKWSQFLTRAEKTARAIAQPRRRAAATRGTLSILQLVRTAPEQYVHGARVRKALMASASNKGRRHFVGGGDSAVYIQTEL